MENKRIYVLMVLCAFFWAGAFIAGKIAVQEIPPFTLAFLRFFFASIIIFPIMVNWERDKWRLKKGDWPIVIALGVIGMFGYHVLFFIALKYTTAINSSMIGATNPLITSILASIIIKEKLGWKRLGAIVLALCGVLLTVTNGDIELLKNIDFNIGDILMFLAVICWATYTVFSKKVMPKYTPIIITTYSFITCLIALIPLAIMERPWNLIQTFSLKSWVSVLYMAIFASVIGYLVQQISIKNIGPSRTMAFINLVPVFSIILSILILNESISLIKLLSALIIIGGVYLNSIEGDSKVEEKIS